MSDQPSVAVAKGAAAIGAAASAQAIDGAHQVGSVFANLFVLTPGNIASWLAALFVFCQLCEWWWRLFWRPLLERLEWIKPKPAKHRRRDADAGPAPLL